MKYEKNLFSNLSKYKPGQITPLENFTTEAFVYLIKYLLLNKNPCVFEILKLFKITKNESIISVKTQNSYIIKSRTLRPDIEIKTNEKIVLIEVKVDSELRKSIFDKNKDQLYDYEKLKEKFDKNLIVCSLTKSFVTSSNKNNVRWYEVANIFSRYTGTDLLIDNFISFLKDNGMEELKCITSETANLISIYHNFMTLLELSYQNSLFTKKSKFKLGKEYKERDGFGYFIKNIKSKTDFFWFGVIPDYSGYIIFEIVCETKKNADLNAFDKDQFSNLVFSNKIKLEDLVVSQSIQIQEKKITDWLNSIYNKLDSFIAIKYL